jgi:hypothetical protein
VNCTGSDLIVMGGICCKDFQVNSAGNCTEQCPTAQKLNENRICEDCPPNKIVNSAKDDCLSSCDAALPKAEIINAAGNACLADCFSAGEITNSAGDACLISCNDGGEISDSDENNQCNGNCAEFEAKLILNPEGNACVPDCKAFDLLLNSNGVGCVPDCQNEFIDVFGEQCVHECNKTKGQLIDAAGDSCVNKCAEGQFINLLGDQCLAMCPGGAHPDPANPLHCQCLHGHFMGVAGDKCEFTCPYYEQDTDNDGQCDG